MDERTDTTNQTIERISTSTTLQTKLPKGIESVVFICPWVESVPDHWLSSNSSLKRIHFADLSSLTTIGNDWMSGCTALVSVNFSGLANLTTVGHNWKVGDWWSYSVDANHWSLRESRPTHFQL